MVVEGIPYPAQFFEFEEVDVANSPHDVHDKDLWVTEMIIVNKTASSADFTVVNKDTTPWTLFNASPFAAKATTYVTFRRPRRFRGGMSITAGTASAFDIAVEGYRRLE